MVRPTPRLVAVAVLAGLLAASCSTSLEVSVPEPSPGPLETTDGPDVVVQGRFTWEDASCDFAEPFDVASSCGWLEVPEHWDDPDDPDTIRLHVGIFSSGPKETDPIVYLEGGPGGDALENIAQSFGPVFGVLADHHDIVVLGQRGTGAAEPHLRCDNVIDLSRSLLDDVSGPTEQLAQYQDAYADCAQGFADDGIDTTAYNSVQNAHDVEALRLALGHERWNVLGISYGTRLGQTLMRLHPDGLRAVILDSVLPTERDPSLDQPATAQRAFETLWQGCSASPTCGEEFGDLETRFFALVDALDVQPVEFEAQDLVSGETFPAAADGTVLMEQTFSALYSKSSFAALPELVAQLEAGDTTGIETLVSQSVTSDPFLADGMFWSVECHEEVPFITQQSTEAGNADDPRYDRLRPDGSAEFLAGVCGSLGAGTAAAVEDKLVNSEIPVLVMAGSYDPITPPADGESLLRGLPNGFFFEYPNTGHAALTDPCGQEMAVAFLADPSLGPAARCIDLIPEPDWTPDIFADLAFEAFSYDAGLFAASGVTPVGWDELGEGTFGQTDNALHTSIIVQQAYDGSSADLLVAGVSGFLGSELEEVEKRTVSGREWTRYQGTIPGAVLDLVVAEADGSTFLVLLQHAPADHDQAVAVLLDPILEAITR